MCLSKIFAPDFPISILLLLKLAQHGQLSSSHGKNNTYRYRKYYVSTQNSDKTVTNTLRRNENLLLYCTTIFLQFSLAQVKTKPLYNQNVSSV